MLSIGITAPEDKIRITTILRCTIEIPKENDWPPPQLVTVNTQSYFNSDRGWNNDKKLLCISYYGNKKSLPRILLMTDYW